MKSKTQVVALFALSFLHCGEAEQPVVDSADAVSTTRPAYVRIERDTRRCKAPKCGGYWVVDLNRRIARRYVNGLDFSNSGLELAEVNALLAAPATELLLVGYLGQAESVFNTRPLMVLDAYRSLPGLGRRDGDWHYEVTVNDPPIQCITAPCNNAAAKRVNLRRPEVSFTALDLAHALKPLVDTVWVQDQIEHQGAIVSAQFKDGQMFPGGPEKILEVSRVWVKIPARPGPCPPMATPDCVEGFVPVYSRTPDRCYVAEGCVEPGMCIQMIPSCEAGYSMLSWPGGPYACPVYVCDPTFALSDED